MFKVGGGERKKEKGTGKRKEKQNIRLVYKYFFIYKL
jgi:hypothetical protein